MSDKGYEKTIEEWELGAYGQGVKDERARIVGLFDKTKSEAEGTTSIELTYDIRSRYQSVIESLRI